MSAEDVVGGQAREGPIGVNMGQYHSLGGKIEELGQYNNTITQKCCCPMMGVFCSSYLIHYTEEKSVSIVMMRTECLCPSTSKVETLA